MLCVPVCLQASEKCVFLQYLLAKINLCVTPTNLKVSTEITLFSEVLGFNNIFLPYFGDDGQLTRFNFDMNANLCPKMFIHILQNVYMIREHL